MNDLFAWMSSAVGAAAIGIALSILLSWLGRRVFLHKINESERVQLQTLEAMNRELNLLSRKREMVQKEILEQLAKTIVEHSISLAAGERNLERLRDLPSTVQPDEKKRLLDESEEQLRQRLQDLHVG